MCQRQNQPLHVYASSLKFTTPQSRAIGVEGPTPLCCGLSLRCHNSLPQFSATVLCHRSRSRQEGAAPRSPLPPPAHLPIRRPLAYLDAPHGEHQHTPANLESIFSPDSSFPPVTNQHNQPTQPTNTTGMGIHESDSLALLRAMSHKHPAPPWCSTEVIMDGFPSASSKLLRSIEFRFPMQDFYVLRRNCPDIFLFLYQFRVSDIRTQFLNSGSPGLFVRFLRSAEPRHA